jgi:threonine dehydratase
MPRILHLPDAAAVRQARTDIDDLILRIPPLPVSADEAGRELFLQLENLQPVGSYKLRGAGLALRRIDPAQLRDGVVTVSAGNLGQGIAWIAGRMGIPCRVLVPAHAPAAKVAALGRLGAEVERISQEAWWSAMVSGELPGERGYFLHGVFDANIMTGHGTIGVDLLDAIPDLDAVVVPFGGGAMLCGIAAVLKARNPRIRIHACEVETGAPLQPALRHGGPVEVPYTPSFVDGIGSRSVFPEMWPLLHAVVEDSIVVTLDEVRAAIRKLAIEHHVIAEGAGAAALAAAMTGRAGAGRIACVISGGHIDPKILADILCGSVH